MTPSVRLQRRRRQLRYPPQSQSADPAPRCVQPCPSCAEAPLRCWGPPEAPRASCPPLPASTAQVCGSKPRGVCACVWLHLALLLAATMSRDLRHSECGPYTQSEVLPVAFNSHFMHLWFSRLQQKSSAELYMKVTCCSHEEQACVKGIFHPKVEFTAVCNLVSSGVIYGNKQALGDYMWSTLDHIYIKSRFRQDLDFLPANTIHKIISAQGKLKTEILSFYYETDCFLPSLP